MLLVILQLICFVAKMLFQWSKKYIYENVIVGLNCNLKLKEKYMTLRTQASVWFLFLL